MYFKPIHLNNFDLITGKLQERYKLFENELLPKDKHIESWDDIKLAIPELAAEFERLNLDPVDFFLFQVAPGEKMGIHIDYYGPEFVHVALNLPVFNCKNTQTNFYKNTQPIWLDDLSETLYKKTALAVSESICELDESLELTSPYLVNVREIHGVTNPTDKMRFIISIRFKENPLHLWN